MAMMYEVPGTGIKWRKERGDVPTVTWDNGQTWHFTLRGEREFCEMHESAVLVESEPSDADDLFERELFGETLDAEIPDDLWEMLSSRLISERG